MKIHACSFASEGFLFQQKLQKDAFKGVGFEDDCIYAHGVEILTDSFFERFQGAGEINRYGYYSFKPYFLHKLLQSIPAGDVLLYMDVNDRPKRGIIDYLQEKFRKMSSLKLLSAGTNYPNWNHMSRYHKDNLASEILFLSIFNFQPEAGVVAIYKSKESLALVRAWLELTLLQSYEIHNNYDEYSRHDQETLYILSRLNKSVQVESWIWSKITGNGLRRYVDYEYYRKF